MELVPVERPSAVGTVTISLASISSSAPLAPPHLDMGEVTLSPMCLHTALLGLVELKAGALVRSWLGSLRRPPPPPAQLLGRERISSRCQHTSSPRWIIPSLTRPHQRVDTQGTFGVQPSNFPASQMPEVIEAENLALRHVQNFPLAHVQDGDDGPGKSLPGWLIVVIVLRRCSNELGDVLQTDGVRGSTYARTSMGRASFRRRRGCCTSCGSVN